MLTRKNFALAALPCPTCGADKPKLEVIHGFLFYQISPKKFVTYVNPFLDNELGIQCRHCNENDIGGGENDDTEFDYKRREDTRKIGVEWTVADLGSGTYARCRRTLAMRSTEIGGTAGFKYGVDFHIQIHCEKCCCKPSEEQGCENPAAGTFTVAYKGGFRSMYEPWARSAARYHLKDPVRHPYKRSKFLLFFRSIRLFGSNLKRRMKRRRGR